MKKLPIFIYILCLLFSAYFLWKIHDHSSRASNAKADIELLLKATQETLKESEMVKILTEKSATETREAEKGALKAMEALEACMSGS